jgi:DNA-binding transcriptional MocR family regulator
MAAPLLSALVLRWLADGSADQIIAAVRHEAAARQSLAARVLGGHPYRAHPGGHHLWLPLPGAWSRAEFAVQLQRHGLAVVTSDSFAVDDAPEHAVRVALGAARNRAELAAALDLLVLTLRSPPTAGRVV